MPSFHSAFVGPGTTAFTSTPEAAYSSAQDFVSDGKEQLLLAIGSLDHLDAALDSETEGLRFGDAPAPPRTGPELTAAADSGNMAG